MLCCQQQTNKNNAASVLSVFLFLYLNVRKNLVQIGSSQIRNSKQAKIPPWRTFYFTSSPEGTLPKSSFIVLKLAPVYHQLPALSVFSHLNLEPTLYYGWTRPRI